MISPELESRNGRNGSDMLDTLIDEGSFSRIGRESGVMLDTLIGEGSFQTVVTGDMSDTLTATLPPKSEFEIKNSELQIYNQY